MQVFEISNYKHILTPPVGKKLLTTLNADIYRLVRSNPELKEIILRGNVCIDGRPLQAISKILASKVDLVQGSSLIFDIAKYSVALDSSMLIMGGRGDVNARAVENLRQKYGCEVYGYAPDRIDSATLDQACALIIKHNIKFVFVCLGAPRQEIAANNMIEKLPDDFTVLFIGAGGSVDFAAGTVMRAPRIVQGMYLEGVYRLVKEPSYKRIKRLITSVWGLGLFYYDLITKNITICSRH